MRKYFFIDYDNTLFSHRTFSVPQDALSAIAGLQSAGHRVILASGRGFQGDRSTKLAAGFIPDGLVSANGAYLAVHGEVLKETYFDPNLQNRLIDFVQEKGYCLMGRDGETWYVTNLERLKKRRRERGSRMELPAKSGEAFNELRDKLIFSFFLDDEEHAIADVEQNFSELKLLRMGTELGGADVIPRENGKAEGMRQILEYYGASLEDAVAIGDSMNDIEMIRLAGLGIAMGNAMQEVKDAADHVAGDIDEGGLKDAVQYALSCQEGRRTNE